MHNLRHFPPTSLRAVSRTSLASTFSQAAPHPYPYPKTLNPTPHQIFHLPQNASQSDVKARYYDLVRIYHPDTAIRQFQVPSDVAHARFQSISTAYDVLRGKTPLSEDGPKPPPAWDGRRRGGRPDLPYIANDRWKDRLLLGGLVVTVGMVVAQTTTTRREAAKQAMLRTRKPAVTGAGRLDEDANLEG